MLFQLLILVSSALSLPQPPIFELDPFKTIKKPLSTSQLQLLQQAIKNANPIDMPIIESRLHGNKELVGREIVNTISHSDESSTSSDVPSRSNTSLDTNTTNTVIEVSQPLQYSSINSQTSRPLTSTFVVNHNEVHKGDEMIDDRKMDTDFTDEEIDEFCDEQLHNQLFDSVSDDLGFTDYNLWEDEGIPKRASLKVIMQKQAKFRKCRLLEKSKPRFYTESRFKTEHGIDIKD